MTIVNKITAAFSTSVTIACVLSATLLYAPPAAADALDDAARQMLSDLQTNSTSPQAFKGQTMNTYTGGTAFIRAPQKNYQLLSFDRPTMSAGCGGINLHGGSISHISAAQFKDGLKSITSAIPGVIFQMAIESVEPLLGANIKAFYDWAEKMNKFNINSCENAKWLVGTAGDALGMSTQSSCSSIGLKLGMDAGEVRQKCNKGSGTASVLADPRASKEIPPFTGNLLWESLKLYTQLDNGDRELIMSITGTTIFYEQSSDASKAPLTVSPTITAAKDLIHGNSSTASGTAGNVLVRQLTCGTDTDKCLNPVVLFVEFESILNRTEKLMTSLSDKIRKGNIAPTAAEKSFVNSIPIPAYQLLAVANAYGDSAKENPVAAAKIKQYNRYVAIEYAINLLARLSQAGVASSELQRYKLTKEQQPYMATAKDYASKMITGMADERASAQREMAGMVQIAQDVEMLKRVLYQNTSQEMKDKLAFGTNMRR